MESHSDDYCASIINAYNLDYIIEKSSWCVKNNVDSRVRLCKYVEQIVRLSENHSLSLDHLFYANDIIEFLAENMTSEPKYLYYLKRMLSLCLLPPTVKSVAECSENPSTLIRFYNVLTKCMRSVCGHAELDTLLFGVIQSSVLRRQTVPENSVALRCCYEAIEMSDLPKTLMELVEKAPSRTFLVDVLVLSYNVAIVSNRSALRMMRSDGVESLVNALRPDLLSMPDNSHERLIVYKFVILLLDRMFSVIREPINAKTEPSPRVTRNTLEVLLCNIKIEMEKDVLHGNTRNDFCHILVEIVKNCSIDENEFSDNIITDIVMLCVWPEIVHVSHWLNDVRFESMNENFVMKNIMLDVTNKVFVNLSRKPQYQELTTILIKAFMMLLDVDYARNTYGDDFHDVINRLLSSLPYLLVNSTDDSTKYDCCKNLLILIKTLKCQEHFPRTMVNAIICVGITSNDNREILQKFKSLKTDILINSIILDSLKTKNCYDFRDIHLCGMNTLNVIYRENQHNPEVQLMVFNMMMRMIKLYFVDGNADETIQLDLLHFIGNAIIRYDDQVEFFAGAGGIEPLLNTLTTAKYPMQLVILSTLVDMASAQRSVRDRIKKWKSPGMNGGYLELMCEIWRTEQVRFGFIDDEFVFAEQRRRTTVENLSDGCSPATDSMYMCAQPKIYSLFRLVELCPDDGRDREETDPREDTVRACRLVSGFRDKATVAHIYHYYSLKTGEVWLENDALSYDPDDAPSPVESQVTDIMTVRHAYLIALLKMIKSQVIGLDAGDLEIKLENKLYENIRRYHSSVVQ